MPHPPEPTIVYGVFDSDNYYAPIRPGVSVRSALMGFGIDNLPAGIWGTVSGVKNDNLNDYLRQAKDEWQKQCLVSDFKDVENPLMFLKGLTLGRTWLYSDQFGSEVSFPDAPYNSYQFILNYASDAMLVGLMEPNDLSDHINDARFSGKPAVVTDVVGDKITLSTGVEFHLTSRYRFNTKPSVVVRNDDMRARLMRHLASQ